MCAQFNMFAIPRVGSTAATSISQQLNPTRMWPECCAFIYDVMATSTHRRRHPQLEATLNVTVMTLNQPSTVIALKSGHIWRPTWGYSPQGAWRG